MISDDQRARKLALNLIRRGLIHPNEAASLLAVSRVTVFRWLKADAINADLCRADYVARLWSLETASKTPGTGVKMRARTRVQKATDAFTKQGNKITKVEPAMPKFSQTGQAPVSHNQFKNEVLMKLRAGTMTIEQAAKRAKVKVAAICGWCRIYGIPLPPEYNQPRRRPQTDL